MTRGLTLVAALAAMLTGAATAAAHGVGWTVVSGEAGVCVAFTYSDGTAMAFAAAEVRDPADGVAQRGRLDRTGGFCFRPDLAGDWRLAADDNVGHRITARVRVAADRDQGRFTAASGQGRAAPVASVAGIIAGLSLTGNAFAVLWWWRSRRGRTPPAEASR